MKNNAMMELNLYKKGNTWKFDDKTLGIRAEPFVLGMSEMIDYHVNNPSIKKTTITFSKNSFPGSLCLHLEYEDSNGGWYKDPSSGLRGWLCPVTRMYMTNIPKKIYFSVKNNSKQNILQSILKTVLKLKS